MAEFIQLYKEPRRMLYLSFISGIVRDLGLQSGLPLWGTVLIRPWPSGIVESPCSRRVHRKSPGLSKRNWHAGHYRGDWLGTGQSEVAVV